MTIRMAVAYPAAGRASGYVGCDAGGGLDRRGRLAGLITGGVRGPVQAYLDEALRVVAVVG
ncbi:hypothetical protein [Streptantibioticus rubrisoli]|uniref:Uncharacterized protein n=1 Tax=Streptantibioticus rubrisoli TaxID=1387313 RepID=A0ABT1PIX6_9ACTN|nr:hypothetical protein [Streptantibioticus rubrisoli]MCQ4045319.1 hypothetical protein [Streptantibioticus rubrisoli]